MNTPTATVATAPVTKTAESKPAATQPKAAEPKAKKVLQPVAAKPAMRAPIAEGQTASRDIKHDGTKATIDYTFKLTDKDPNRYQATTELDFDGLSTQELRELAIAHIRVIIQRNLRAMGAKALDATIYKTLNVKRDIIDAQRAQRAVEDNMAKASRAVKSLSAAEKQALIAQLTAE